MEQRLGADRFARRAQLDRRRRRIPAGDLPVDARRTLVNCSVMSAVNAPTTPIQLRAACEPVSAEALFHDGSSGEYEASARKRRSAETHIRNPISSLSRRFPVGTKMPAR